MKLAIAQLNYLSGNFDVNTQKICRAIQQAESHSADLIVFSELAISGFPVQDYLEYSTFARQCEQSLKYISKNCQTIACIVGLPTRNPLPTGKPLFNSAAFCHKGEVSYFHKSKLSDEGFFTESRYFEEAAKAEVIYLNENKIALVIGEELLNLKPEENSFFVEKFGQLQPDLILNIAASPFHYGRAIQRRNSLQSIAQNTQLPVLFVNQAGAQTELIFDGGSMVVNAEGVLSQQLSFFEEELAFFHTSELKKTHDKLPAERMPSKIALIHDALVLGIKDFFAKSGFSRAILGLSGGLDSAVTMALAAQALGSNKVLGLLMPSAFSSHHSLTDAYDLARNLGSPTEKLSIAPLFDAVVSELEPLFENKAADLTEENIQARLRGMLLMAMSNKHGYILLNTSNKSEIAVGYGTLYGDMAGSLAVLGDVYKTEVYELARYINREKEIIPLNTISKPPSAELRSNQKDSDSLPDYAVLDSILYRHIELQQGFEEIAKQGFDKTTVASVLHLVSRCEYKRKQAAPVLRISPKAFGVDRHIPLGGKFIP